MAALVVYWRTLLPTVSTWGDSAKFQYIAQVWGIPHPTGYPLYILLTRFSSLLPWGDIAYRVNLLSAFCGAAAVGVLVLVANRVSGDRWAATAAALMVAFSPIFWSQAVIAEVYALNALWVTLCFYLILRWRSMRGASPGSAPLGTLYAFVLVYGLSFSHHLSMVLLFPAFLFWVVWHQPRALARPDSWLVGLLGIGLGLLPYSYILLRAAQGAVYSEFPPLAGRSLLEAFGDYVTGGQFRGAFFAAFDSGPAALLSRVQFFAGLLTHQFGWWGVGLGLLGLIVLWGRDRVLAVGLGLAFLGETVFALGYDIIDPEVYFIPSFLIWALLVASGLGWLGRRLRPLARWRRFVPGLLFGAVCIMLVVLPLVSNWFAADQSRNWSARLWAEAFLHDVEPDALLVLPQPYFYSQKQVLLYMMLAEGIKPDLEFIQPAEIDNWVGRRPVYLAVWMPEVAQRYRVQPVDSSDVTVVEFVERVPEGMIVAAAVKDEASLSLSDEAAAAWQLVGGQASVKGCFRCSHGLIGVKGASPGAAQEAAGRGMQSLMVQAGDEIGTTGVRAPLEMAVCSAGFDDGNLGEIWLGGRQVSPQHRGYNIAVVSTDDGQLMTTAYVDTFVSDLVDNVRKYRVELVEPPD
jgi:4-amino-4-deoxy-L-arabinose transferase-like glycosyltransferase